MDKEKIELGYRNIGKEANIEYYHKFLLYTNKSGEQYTISGWTGEDKSPELPNGHIHVQANKIYDKENDDHPDNHNAHFENTNKPQKQYRELIIEGDDLSQLWKTMVDNAMTKDGIYPYDSIMQNSNTLADSILRDCNLPIPKHKHFAPGSRNNLDENLIPHSNSYYQEHKSKTVINAIQSSENNLPSQPNFDQLDWNNPNAVFAELEKLGKPEESPFMQQLAAEFHQQEQEAARQREHEQLVADSRTYGGRSR